MNQVRRLQQVYSAGEARSIYRMVMEQRFGLTQTDLLLGKDTELSPNDTTELENIVQRLLLGEPVQYILGECRFLGRQFHVSPEVLIPRPETEELVELVLRTMPPASRILDIGTGSGCIAISLALEGHLVTATDVSEGALSVARKNAESLHASVHFKHENILHSTESQEQWNAIVSNPPYICRSEAKEMEELVLKNEPHLALFVPDEDPLLFYRAIAQYGTKHLAVDGHIFFEINRLYGKDVMDMLAENGYRNIEIHTDQYGNNRIVEGCL